MSFSSASILSRIEDALLRYIKKLSPFIKKLVIAYTSGQRFDRAEQSLAIRILGIAGKAYGFSHIIEKKLVLLYRVFAKKMIGLQASLEDAVSFASLYMNMLFVVSLLLMVVIAWNLS